MTDQHAHTLCAILSTSGAILADIAAPMTQDPTARFGIWAAGISLVGVAVANTIKAIGGAVLDGVNKWSESNAGKVHQQIEDLQEAVAEGQARLAEANSRWKADRDEAQAEAARRDQEIERLTRLLAWTQDQLLAARGVPISISGALPEPISISGTATGAAEEVPNAPTT